MSCEYYLLNTDYHSDFVSRKDAKAQIGYYCLVLTTHIRQQLARG